MVIRWFRFNLFLALLVLATALSADAGSDKPMEPIYDGQDGLLPTLRLQHCWGWVQEQEGAYGLASRTITMVYENWYSGRTKGDDEVGRVLTIDRWYFDDPKDIPYFPTIPGKMGTAPFPGWDKSPEFGERSVRFGATVLFSKSNVLVLISVNSKRLSRSRSSRSYVDAVARKVEAAIHEGVNRPQPRS